MGIFDQTTDFGAPEGGIQPDLTMRESVARMIDNEAFLQYDPLSKSMFTDEYKTRIDIALVKADQIIAFLQEK